LTLSPTKEARHGCSRAGRWPVQLRYTTELTDEEYVTQSAWEDASLPCCPLHPEGGCGFARHGTYSRVEPPGTKVARWYCSLGHCTFSLLPDCLAARLCGSLDEVEAAVERTERASSQEVSADLLRPDIELPGGLRWIRHRTTPIHHALNTLKGLLPETFAALPPTVTAFREALGVDQLLPTLREIAEPYLHQLPPPLGFRPPLRAGGDFRSAFQHPPGRDPPAAQG
jgi:hypothetical protein